MLTIREKILKNKQNIKNAIEDYWKYTDEGRFIKNDISENFINTLADKNAHSKQELRNMLRKSPAWNEELDALVIDDTMTHEPDYCKIENMAYKMFQNVITEAAGTHDHDRYNDLYKCIYFFSRNKASAEDKIKYIEAIKRIAPRAYAPGKKTSRIFKGICDALNITDEAANSDFQREFAKIADEMSSRQIHYKLYISVNPAHFLTMSNPKCDSRGSCLTSCHSFNSDNFSYNNGCTGYACDAVTMIVFTADGEGEKLNNRKTSRQLFMYQPGNGFLMQSRMYNTSGGTTGAQKESKIYRRIVQREISRCENAINYWKTYPYIDNRFRIEIDTDYRFGGYPDWDYEEYDAKFSVRKDKKDTFHLFTIGAPGLCIRCGEETESDDGLYCSSCNREDDDNVCDCCGEVIYGESYDAYDRDGTSITICEHCYENEFSYCSICGETRYQDNFTYIEDEGEWVCDECLETHYTRCDECGNYVRNEDSHEAIDAYGNTVSICEHCLENEYIVCEDCDSIVHPDYTRLVYDGDGCSKTVCENCVDEYYEECEECSNYFPAEYIEDGLCPSCKERLENEEKENDENNAESSNKGCAA